MKQKSNKTVIVIGLLAILLVLIVAGAAMYMTGNVGSGTSYEKKIALAEQELAAGNTDNAITAYYEAIDIDPSGTRAYTGLADIYEASNDTAMLRQVLEMGYQSTMAPEFSERLEMLDTVMLGEPAKDSMESRQIWNDEILLDSAEYTYGEYVIAYGEGEAGDPAEDVTMVSGMNYSVVYEDQGIVLYFPEEPDEDSNPSEIHLMNLDSLLVGGGSGTVPYEKLYALIGVDEIKIETVDGIGSAVRFVQNGCTVTIPSDESGNVSADAMVYIITPTAEERSKAGGNHKLYGTIIDAVTGDGIQGVMMTAVLAGTESFDTVTDASGHYQFTELREGKYTVTLKAPGYIDVETEVEISQWKTEFEQNLNMVPEGAENEIRVVLTWGSTPLDLDSYLYCEAGTLFFENRALTAGGGTIADLDLDDTDGNGPETITIYEPNGRYEITVADFHHTNSIADSGANVTVYRGGTEIASFDVPAECQNVWDVCVIENGEVKEITDPSGDYREDNGTVAFSSR